VGVINYDRWFAINSIYLHASRDFRKMVSDKNIAVPALTIVLKVKY
jgi:hypothetical protein